MAYDRNPAYYEPGDFFIDDRRAILAIEAEARASLDVGRLDVRNLMRDALSMLEDSEPLHASDDHRMWRIMDSLREYAAQGDD